MQQKTTLIRFLVIGISMIFLTLYSCCNDCDEPPLSHDNYIYINNSSKDIVLTIYGSDGISQAIPIAIQDSLAVSYTGNPGTAPFMHTAAGTHIGGDSVTIKFIDGKCLNYNRVDNSGVFNFMNYDNPADHSTKDFTLYYTITEAIYNTATPCP